MKRIAWSIALLGLIACSCATTVEPDKHHEIIMDIRTSYPESTDLKVKVDGSEVSVHFKIDDNKYEALYRNKEWQHTMRHISVFDLSFELTDLLATQYADAHTTKVIEKENRHGVFYYFEMEDESRVYELVLDEEGIEIEDPELFFED